MLKFGFIHIPKTGGHYVHRCCNFEKNNIHNFCHDAYHDMTVIGWDSWNPNSGFDINRESCFKGYKHAVKKHSIDELFTVVRNPFDLLVSYYFYFDCTGWANCNKIHNFNSFNEFIEGYLNPSINWHYPIIHKHIFGQLYDESRLVVKKENILRLETINKDLINFKEWYNLDIITDFKRICNINPNRPSRDYKEFYTSKQVKRLEEKLGDILTTFNYSF